MADADAAVRALPRLAASPRVTAPLRAAGRSPRDFDKAARSVKAGSPDAEMGPMAVALRVKDRQDATVVSLAAMVASSTAAMDLDAEAAASGRRVPPLRSKRSSSRVWT